MKCLKCNGERNTLRSGSSSSMKLCWCSKAVQEGEPKASGDPSPQPFFTEEDCRLVDELGMVIELDEANAKIAPLLSELQLQSLRSAHAPLLEELEMWKRGAKSEIKANKALREENERLREQVAMAGAEKEKYRSLMVNRGALLDERQECIVQLEQEKESIRKVSFNRGALLDYINEQYPGLVDKARAALTKEAMSETNSLGEK